MATLAFATSVEDQELTITNGNQISLECIACSTVECKHRREQIRERGDVAALGEALAALHDQPYASLTVIIAPEVVVRVTLTPIKSLAGVYQILVRGELSCGTLGPGEGLMDARDKLIDILGQPGVGFSEDCVSPSHARARRYTLDKLDYFCLGMFYMCSSCYKRQRRDKSGDANYSDLIP